MPLSVPFTDWFATRGWRVRRHQAEMLAVAERGEHTLLVAATGAGKTLAGFLPSLVDLAANPSDRLHTLYVSPLKALAADVERNLLGPIRSEEQTHELPSLMRTSYAVFCLKKKKTKQYQDRNI